MTWRSARLELLASTLCFTLAQTAVKLIPEVPAHEIVFLRSLLSGVITFYFLRRARLSPWGRNRPMLLLRGLLGTVAMVLYFYTLQRLPLSSAITLHYLYPIFTIALAARLLKESPTVLQWVCVFISFFGVVLIKGFDVRVTLVLLSLAVTSAFFDALTFTLIRALRNEDHALVVVFYLPLVSFITLAPFALPQITAMSAREALVILFIGIFAQLGQYLMTRAYQRERAASIANLNYISPIIAIAIGAVGWNETISVATAAGVVIITASALCTSLSVKGKTSLKNLMI